MLQTADSLFWRLKVAILQEMCNIYLQKTGDIETIRREIQIIDQGTHRGGKKGKGKKQKART